MLTDDQLNKLFSQAQGAINAGADPLRVNKMMRSYLESVGVDTNKRKVLVSANLDDGQTAPVEDSIKDFWLKPIVRGETKNELANITTPEVMRDLNRFDYTPNQVRGDTFSTPAKREVGGWEAGNRFFQKGATATAGLLAPVSYLGAAAGDVLSGESPRSYGAYQRDVTAASKALNLQPNEELSAAGNVGAAVGSLAWDLPVAMISTPARLAGAGAGLSTSAYKAIMEHLAPALAGGVIPSMSEADAVYRLAKDSGASEADAIKTAAKAGLMKEAEFAAPVAAAGNLAKRAASGAAINAGLAAPDEYAQTGKLGVGTLTAAGLGTVLGGVGGQRASVRDALSREGKGYKTGDIYADAGAVWGNKILENSPLDSTGSAFDFDAAAARQADAIAARTKDDAGNISQSDLFGGNDVPAELAEARRVAAMQEAEAGNPTKSSETQKGLEIDFLQARKDRLAAEQAAEDAASREQGLQELESQHDAGNNPAPEAQAELWDVGVPKNGQPADATIHTELDANGEPVIKGYTEEAPNETMRAAFADAQTRRGIGLDESNLYPDIAHNDVDAPATQQTERPSRARTPEEGEPAPQDSFANAEQAELPLEGGVTRPDNLEGFQSGQASDTVGYHTARRAVGQRVKELEKIENNKNKLLTDEERTELADLRKALASPSRLDTMAASGMLPAVKAAKLKKGATDVASETSVANRIAAARANNNPFASIDEPARPSRLDNTSATPTSDHLNKAFNWAPEVVSKFDEGTLTGRDVINNVPHNASAQDKTFITELAGMLDKYGGMGTPFSKYDSSNPVHTEAGSRVKGGLDNTVAFYDTQTATVYVVQKAAPSSLVHELGHAATSLVISLGHRKQLDPHAQAAFDDFQLLFDELRTDASHQALLDTASMADGARSSDFHRRTYGLEDLHEFESELRSNGKFRDNLRTTPLTPSLLRDMSFEGRRALARVGNVLNAVTTLLRKAVGLSPKMQNAYDALYMASNKFHKSVGKETSDAVKSTTNRNVRNEAPDLSFLGEQVPMRASKDSVEQSESPKLHRAQSMPEQIVRQLFFPKKINETVTHARRKLSNLRSVGKADVATMANRLRKVVTKENAADFDKASMGDVEAYKRLDPDARREAKRTYMENYDRSFKQVDLIMSNPHRTKTEEAQAAKIAEEAGRHQVRSYAANIVNGYMKDKLKLAEVGRKKAAAGKELSSREYEAMADVDNAKLYLSSQYFPDLDKIPKLSTENLTRLYDHYTSTSAANKFEGYTPEMKRAAMEATVAEKLRKMVDKEGQLDYILKEVAGLGDRKSDTRKYYSGMRRGSDILAKRENVPEPLRKLWGEIEEPVAKALVTANAQYSNIATLSAQSMLRKEGLANGLFVEDAVGAHREAIKGDTMGELQGLFTTPDVKRAMDSVFTTNNMVGDLLDASLIDSSGLSTLMHTAWKAAMVIPRVTGAAKLASVVGNWGAFALNAFGGVSQLSSNGNYNVKSWGKGIADMKDSMLIERQSELKPNTRDILQYGLAEFSMLHELQRSRYADTINSILEKSAGSINPLREALRLAKKARKDTALPAEFTKEFYGAMDLHTKFANWHFELDHQIALNEKHNLGKSLEEIKEFTARRINDTNITPSLAPQAVKIFEGVGATQYATYYAEVTRATIGNMIAAKQDFMQGIKLNDKALMTRALVRTTGNMASYIGMNKLYFAMGKGAMGLLGLALTQIPKDDDRRKYLDKDEFYSGIEPALVTDENDSKASENVWDMSRPDPMAPFWNVMSPMINAIGAVGSGDTKKAEALVDKAYKRATGLFTRNTLWKGVAKAARGQEPSIARAAPSYYKEKKQLYVETFGLSPEHADVWLNITQPFVPRSYKNIQAARDIENPNLKKAVISGLGVTEFDANKNVKDFLGKKTQNVVNAGKKQYTDLMKLDFKSSPERLESEFKSALKDSSKAYEVLQAATDAAKAQGKSRGEILAALKEAGVSKALMYSLYKGKGLDSTALLADLKSNLKDSYKEAATAEKKKELIDRYRYNTQQMLRLIRKYRSTDLENI